MASSQTSGPHAMTQSYKQLQRQIEVLQREAEKLRSQEIREVVGQIKVAVAHYGISAAQLGFGTAASGSARAAKASKPALSRSAKYADGQGNEWSGRGPRPHWLRDALKAGKDVEEFAVSSASTKADRGDGKVSAKRRAKTQYRDRAGNSWSGMGPRPRWLKEALEAGQTLKQLAA